MPLYTLLGGSWLNMAESIQLQFPLSLGENLTMGKPRGNDEVPTAH